ncbi:MAG: hypothetical protein CSA76_02780 [Spirochaetales bacterium]|nr:MAG: hypothetical protein CSA76_02780 [Spirochaetales bacterium]
MKISINGSPVDFTLEKEQTAEDILTGMSSWLEDRGMLVAGIQLNGEAVSLDGAEWKKNMVESIDTMEFQVMDHREARASQLQTARDFFTLMNQAAASSDSTALEELAAGYEDVKKLLPHLLSEGTVPADPNMLDSSLANAGFPPSGGKSCNFDSIASDTGRMALILDARFQETASPQKTARSTVSTLVSIAENLEDVAVQLQTGKDKEAMKTIVVLSEMLQSLMRSLSWLPPSDKSREIISDMNSVLYELEEALKASDTVLIGDLLEYEIKPQLLELPGRLDAAGETE